MKIVSEGLPDGVIKALSTPKFAEKIIAQVMGHCLGAENPLDRPSEYYVQVPDVIVQAKDGFYGVEFRLTGASRNGRTHKQFYKALAVQHGVVKDAIIGALKKLGSEERIQVFTVLMLDGDIEVKPDSGVYSNIPESDAEWVSAT